MQRKVTRLLCELIFCRFHLFFCVWLCKWTWTLDTNHFAALCASERIINIQTLAFCSYFACRGLCVRPGSGAAPLRLGPWCWGRWSSRNEAVVVVAVLDSSRVEKTTLDYRRAQLEWIWNDFAMMVEWFCHDVGMMLVCCWYDVGMLSEWFWN